MTHTVLPNKRTDDFPAYLHEKRTFVQAALEGARPEKDVRGNLGVPRNWCSRC